MGSLSFNAKVSRDGREVLMYTRQWDGIDHPDYESIGCFSPDDARYLAQQLFSAAEKIDGKSRKDRTAAKIRRNTEEIARRAKLEATS